MAKRARTQVIEGAAAAKGAEATASKSQKAKRAAIGGKRQPSDPGEMQKEYEVLTDKAIIHGKLRAIGDKVKMTIKDAMNHRERGVGLRFPHKDAA